MPFHNLKLLRAFTLSELLVVVGIVAVLTGGILATTISARDKGKDARRKQDLQAISFALVAYRTDHNVYFKNGTISNYASDIGINWITNFPIDYITKMPHDPANKTTNAASTGDTVDCNNKSNIYCYIVSSNQKTFILWAQLENSNDPELISNTSAKCRETSPNGNLNFCLKSPPL